MTDFASSLNAAVRLHQSGQFAAARQQYQALRQLQPNHPDLLHLLGLIEHQTGNYSEAVNLIKQALTVNPQAFVFHANIGESYRVLGQHKQAIFHLQRAIQLNPRFAPPLNSLGIICRLQGRLEDAAKFYHQALQINPSLADAEINLGLVLRDLGRHEDAMQHARRGVELNPNSAAGHNNLANVLKDEGDIQTAIGHYRQAISLDPNYGQAYSNWAQSKRFHADDQDELQQMEGLLVSGQLTRDSASNLHFALGKAYDDCQQWEKAFAHFRQANELAEIRFDRERFQQYVDSIIEAYDAAFFQHSSLAEGDDSDSRVPIFVVGMPRSGTSLVEQILASHRDVAGVGERKEIALITSSLQQTLQSSVAYPGCAAELDQQTARRLAGQYLETISEVGGGAPRVVDKMMTNFLHLGLIAKLFPRAPVVHTRRHPLDVCLSCYFQNFSHRPSHTFNLEDLGFYYGQYARLMSHWANVLPMPVLDLPYEDLVGDQETHTRRLLQFCGLAWDDACLNFHATSRVVLTASSWQVRQPMNKRSVARWRNYQQFLLPLRESLGDVLP